MAKKIVFWMSNAYGTTSCHLNAPNLSYAESRLGHIYQKDGEWFSVINDELAGPHKSYLAAKRHVEAAVGGQTL